MVKKIALLSFLLCSTTFFSQTSNSILWRISGKNLVKPSYVYGTIHIKDKRVFNVNDSVLNFIQQCDAFACELHPDSLNALIFTSMSKKDTTADGFKKYLDSKEYELVNKKLQKDIGLNLSQIKNKNMKFLKLLLNPVKQKADDYPTFLDGYLMQIAKRTNRNIVGLEYIKSHDEALNSLGSKDDLKKEIVDLSKEENSEDKLEQLIKLYLNGDINKIQENTTLMSYESQHDLIYVRNRIMAHSIDSILRSKTLFATCGAAHLGGDNGIINLLKEKGYTVTPVFPAKTSYLSLTSLPQNFSNWQTVSNSNLGFSCQLPGAPASYFKGGNYSDMQMYIDIGSGFTYAIFPMASSLDINDKQKIYGKLLESLKKSAYDNALLYNKEVSHKGSDGIEVEYLSTKTISVKIRIFIENNILYTFFVIYPSGKADNKEFEYFFSNISFNKPVKGDVYSYTNKQWGFEMDLPVKPFEKTDVSREGTTRVEALSFKSSDNVTGIHYYFECTEAGEGRYYTNDSILLYGIRNRFSGMKELLDMKDSLFTLNGNKYNQTTAFFNDNSTLVSWTILKGFKLYKLKAVMSRNTYNTGAYQSAFQSFKFLPASTDHYKMVKTPLDSLLTIRLPQEFKKTPKKSEEAAESKNPLYRSFDANTGLTYYMQKIEGSDYYYSVSDSVYWKKVQKRLVNYFDTLLYSRELNINGLKAKELIVKDKKETTITRHLVFGFGKDQYDLYAYLPENDSSERSLLPFKNVHYSGNYKEKIVSDTSAFRRLVTDVFSPDSTIKKKSRSAFYQFKLTANVFSQVKDVLNSPNYVADTTGYVEFNIKTRLLNSLDDLEPSVTYDYIKAKLNDPKTEKELLPHYASALASIKTKQAYETLNTFYATHLLGLNEYSGSLFIARDSFGLATILYPAILEAFAKDTAENYALINLTTLLLDSGLLKYEQVKPYEADLFKQSLTYAGQVTDKKLIFETSYNEGLLDILGYAPDKTNLYDHLNQLAASKNHWAAYYASYYLLKYNQPVKEKVTESIAAHPYLRNLMYNGYGELKRLDAFPRKYKNQQSLAEADLFGTAYDSDEVEISKMEFMKKKTELLEGRKAEFYLFKVSFNDEDTYLAFAGPYYVGEEPSNVGAKTTIYYDEVYYKGSEDLFYPIFLTR